jgi:outer membrane murein-binding lipoprotein Lpp
MHTVSLIVVGVVIGVVVSFGLVACAKKLKTAYTAWRVNHLTLHARVEKLEHDLAARVEADAAAVAAKTA